MVVAGSGCVRGAPTRDQLVPRSMRARTESKEDRASKFVLGVGLIVLVMGIFLLIPVVTDKS